MANQPARKVLTALLLRLLLLCRGALHYCYVLLHQVYRVLFSSTTTSTTVPFMLQFCYSTTILHVLQQSVYCYCY